MNQPSTLQTAIELIDSLSPEDQAALLEMLQKRILVREIQEIRQEVAQGDVQFGSVADFLDEIDENEPNEQILADLQEAIRQGRAGETFPIAELWDGIDV